MIFSTIYRLIRFATRPRVFVFTVTRCVPSTHPGTPQVWNVISVQVDLPATCCVRDVALPVLPPLLSSSWTSLLQWSVGAAADLVWIHVQINLCKYSQLICVVLVQDNLLSRFRTATVTLKTVRRPGVHFALVDPFHTLRRELSPSCVETMLFTPQFMNPSS